MYPFLLFAHILAATLWTGGHLVLALGFLPEALRRQDIGLIEQFEQRYENIGLSALAIQILSGIWLANLRQPDWQRWLSFSDATSSLIALKLILLAVTLALALHARLRLLPNLAPQNLQVLAWHIFGVTALSVLFLVVGIGFRSGGI